MYRFTPKVRDLPFPVTYVISVLLVGLAILLTSALWLIVERPISAPLFLAAIVVSTWLGGIRVGIFSSLISGLAIDFFFVQPYWVFAGTQDEVIRLALFLGEGSLLSWLIERLRTTSEEIRASREDLRELTKHQQTLRESEQKRIALEIHDELGQALMSLKMDTHFLTRSVAELEPKEKRHRVLSDLEGLSGRIDNTIGTVRRITSELRPSILDDFGLVAASEWQAHEFEQTTEIKCRFSTDVDELDLGSDSNTAVFRILQEALTNIARHASARSVSIALRKVKDHVTMTVSDDGKGIARSDGMKSRSLGLLGMRERSRIVGGELDVFANPSGGTTVELKIPFARPSI